MGKEERTGKRKWKGLHDTWRIRTCFIMKRLTLVMTHTSTLLPLPKSLKIPEEIASHTKLIPSSLWKDKNQKNDCFKFILRNTKSSLTQLHGSWSILKYRANLYIIIQSATNSVSRLKISSNTSIIENAVLQSVLPDIWTQKQTLQQVNQIP